MLPASVGTGFVWHPPRAATGVAILIHGLQSHAGWFLAAGERLAAHGLAVYAPDRRGSGRSAAPRGNIHDFRHWLADLAEVVALATSECPGAGVHLVGHCFGANIALAAELSGAVAAESIVMLTPGLFVLPTYSTWTKLQIALAGLLAPATTFRVPQDDDLFSRDPDVLAWIVRDTLGSRRVTARTLMQINRMLRDIRAGLPSLTVPTLVLEAARDRLSDNARNRKVLTETLGSSCVWQTFDAEHFLLAEPCADDVLDAIVRWTHTCHEKELDSHP
jgi:alpha-beta hydrolase superfamily lysophospholipase